MFSVEFTLPIQELSSEFSDTFVSEEISLVPEFQFQTKFSVQKTDQKRYLCRDRSAGWGNISVNICKSARELN